MTPTEINPPDLDEMRCPPHIFKVGTKRTAQGDTVFFVDVPFLYCEACGETRKVEL